MKPRFLILAACQMLSAVVLMLAPTAWAGDGNDHGDAPPAASGDGPKRLPDGSVSLPASSSEWGSSACFYRNRPNARLAFAHWC